MIATLQRSDKTNDRNEWDAIFRNLDSRKRESYEKMIKVEPFVVINKQWMFGLLEAHYAQSNGYILTDVRNQIGDLYRAAAVELCKGY